MEKATEAREKNNIGTLMDETNLALVNIKMENNLADLTVSEKIDKLKEKGILNDDMTFVSNSDYSLSYNGNIIDANNNIKNNIQLYDNAAQLEVNVQSGATAAVGTRIVKAVNGKVYFDNENNKSNFTLEANPAPEGYKFAYWINQNNDIIVYKSKLPNYSVITDTILTAIYVKESEAIIPKVCITVYSTTQTQDNKLQFQSFAYMPFSTTDFQMTSTGVLATNNISLANENYMTIEKETNTTDTSKLFYNRGGSPSSSAWAYVFAWSKGNVGTQTFYVRGYSTIKNKQTGETQTYYSNIISVHK